MRGITNQSQNTAETNQTGGGKPPPIILNLYIYIMANLYRKNLNVFADAVSKVSNASERATLADDIGKELETLNKSFCWETWRNACNVKQQTEPRVIHKAGQTFAEANYTNFC